MFMPKRHPTKMGKMKMSRIENWREQVTALFYEDRNSISEIQNITGISRKSISAHLRTTAGYEEERKRRREKKAEMRKQYKRDWDRDHRSARYSSVTSETIKREHEVAVMILSHEKY